VTSNNLEGGGENYFPRRHQDLSSTRGTPEEEGSFSVGQGGIGFRRKTSLSEALRENRVAGKEETGQNFMSTRETFPTQKESASSFWKKQIKRTKIARKERSAAASAGR